MAPEDQWRDPDNGLYHKSDFICVIFRYSDYLKKHEEQYGPWLWRVTFVVLLALQQ
jgi:hypothetical protein